MLAPDDAEHVLEKGYVVLRGCFSREAAAEFTAGICGRLDVREFAPKVWGAVCDLVGGAERIATDQPCGWNDSFIVNLWEVVATDSVAPVARFLADHPQGRYPADHPARPDDVPVIPYADLTAQKAQNVLRRPRFITNPPLTLAEPMRFDRAHPDDHCLVERAVLRALGATRAW